MKYRIIFLLAGIILQSKIYANAAASGDIVARDLNFPGVGWLGHTAMVTGDNVGATSNIVIEAMNDTIPAIEFTPLSTFKRRSPYWGSRFGITDINHLKKVLIEMNHQRWWCPEYSYTRQYKIGRGNPHTGEKYECGKWRCDTIVAYAFWSAGITQLSPEMNFITPRAVFNMFPYINNTSYNKNKILPPKLSKIDKDFSDLTAIELNNMPFEEFQMIADPPLNQTTPSHIVQEWKLANDSQVNDIKRGMFIDRLSMSNEPNVIPRFIKMYEETNNIEVKRKLITGTVTYYQSHDEQVKNSGDKELLRTFYKKLLGEKLHREGGDRAIRGFMHFHSNEEFMENKKLIDQQFNQMDSHSVLSLKLELSHRNKEFEAIYLPQIIEMLKKEKSSNLDEMFFGLTQFGWKHFKNKESLELIRNYIKFTSKKYEKENHDIAENDVYFEIARGNYSSLKKDLM